MTNIVSRKILKLHSCRRPKFQLLEMF